MLNFCKLGLAGLQEKLRTNIQRGLTSIDLKEREEHFGSNYKEPQKRTPFCRLFLGALEDFMLRLLLVCAVISISIDMGFASKSDRSHGKHYHSFSFLSSLDRRSCHFHRCICGRHGRILERLQEGRTIPQAPSHQ